MTDTLQAHVAYAKLPAQDVERARRFYDEKLGLRPFDEHDAYHLFYDVGGARFLVFQSNGAPSGNHDQLGFVVDDIRARVDELRDRGVVFEDYDNTVDGVADLGPVRAAWFKDSEGNVLNLIEGLAVDGSRRGAG
jgi:catechol 2,3-dioxygenase-like lactoylglutathione lyase family enzyme